ncbi:peptidase M48 family protein [Natrialba magadii ATCC 43099]|uniref:Peptidase M48 Ste24p n=1 Tax=Natrialba magadii (strain ATCC 43099 / DSM 3394 / CCM 3739 / CIP 104546 / IAM 13178 / JCM 8861 / NBRC 102185 / NCIMB 2190 / MS3) TaxID=547559 RepID=D3SY94_NATMM|nr:M56 family metallopeptidase [Natrialba magadii]ADD06065.1 peptidase M48 family protein [Natrialba magadii ATCC 43099]ELY30938.1 peptidase M48 Ste24p [Natrialba magadii ATCC 43099]
MPLTPDRRLQGRIAAAFALVVGVNGLVLSVLVWSIHRLLSASGRSLSVELGVPASVGALLVGAIGLVAVQARYGSLTAVSGLEPEPIDGDGPRNVGARVRRLATQADVPQPAVAVADCTEPNCLTVGSQRSPTIVVTTGLLDALGDTELDAALAHEVAHLANRDLTVVSAVAAIVAIGDRLLERERMLRGVLVAMIVFVIRLGPVFGLMLLFVLVAPFVAITVGFLVVSPVARLLLGIYAITLGLFAKAREYAADRGASQLVGDPAAVASALETLDGGDRPKRDARLDASATLGIVSQSLSIDWADGEGDEDGDADESWFERLFVGQFDMWRENVSEFGNRQSENGFDQQRSSDRGAVDADANASAGAGDDSESKSWIVEPLVKPVVDPIRDRIRQVLTWRPPTHPTTESRIERLQMLERRRCD